jgi:5'-nucleotidase
VIYRKAENHLVDDRLFAKDPDQARLISIYENLTSQVENRIIGAIAASLTRQRSPAGEMALGDVIADAQLAALASADNGGAQIAFMNNGGIRSDILKHDGGTVTFGDIFAVQPFGNKLLTLTLTGGQIKTLLEQQWTEPTGSPTLQVSEGFFYSWSAGRPVGDKVQSMTLNGTAIDPFRTYRVGITDFLAGGADHLAVLREGKAPQAAMPDIEAMESYFHARSPITPGPMYRIQRLN